MKDRPISITNLSINSHPINNPPCNINNITNSLSHMVQPYSSSAGWGIYGDQQTWADLHLR